MKLLDTFDRFLAYLEHERGCAEGTLVAYRSDLLQLLAWLDRTIELERAQGIKRPTVRPNDLGHLTTVRIREWQASLSQERRLSPAAIRRKLHCLGAFCKYLVLTGAIGANQNPMLGVTPPKKRKRVRAGLPLETWRAVLALPLRPRDAAIRGVFAWAGLRREELIALTAGDVRLEVPGQSVLLVHGKGDKERLVPVPAPLRELLLDYLLRTGKTGPRERLFTTPNGVPLNPSAVNRLVAAWGRQVGTHLHPHLFRHSYATFLVASGVPLDLVQAWLGHEDLSTTAAYLHAANNPNGRRLLDSWAGSILSPPALQAAIGTPENPDPNA